MKTLKAWIPSLKFILQDTFHLAHAYQDHANNMHPLFYKLIVVEQRNCVVKLDEDTVETIDTILESGDFPSLKAGKVELEVGHKYSPVEIMALKESGAYHKLFVETASVCGFTVYSPEEQQERFKQYRAKLEEFAKQPSSSTLFDSSFLTTHFPNLVRRAACCYMNVSELDFDMCPTTGSVGWGGLPRRKSLWGTNTAENRFAFLPLTVRADNAADALGTTLMRKGAARMNTKQRCAAGAEEYFGHYDRGAVDKVNAGAVTSLGADFGPLVAQPPYNVPPLKGGAEVVPFLTAVHEMDPRDANKVHRRSARKPPPASLCTPCRPVDWRRRWQRPAAARRWMRWPTLGWSFDVLIKMCQSLVRAIERQPDVA